MVDKGRMGIDTWCAESKIKRIKHGTEDRWRPGTSFNDMVVEKNISSERKRDNKKVN